MSSLLAFAAGGLGLLTSSGCGGDCLACQPGEVGVWCKIGLKREALCAPDQFLAEASCADAGGYPISAQTCKSYASGGGETGGNEETGGDETETGTSETGEANDAWDPSKFIFHDERTSIRTIDAAFVDKLRLDPNILYLDSTLTSLDTASGYYTIANAGELAGALGWQEGDLLLSLNSHDLQGLDAVLDAYIEVESLDRFTLDLEREGVVISMTYTIE